MYKCNYYKDIFRLFLEVTSFLLAQQGLDGAPGDKGDDGEAGQPVSMS